MISHLHVGGSRHIGRSCTLDQYLEERERIVFKVKSDNVTALTLLIKMRTSSPTLAVIARELALHLVDLSFTPDAAHTPGVGHVFADKLSRVFSPTGKGVLTPDLHPAMATAQVAHAPLRCPLFYKVKTA